MPSGSTSDISLPGAQGDKVIMLAAMIDCIALISHSPWVRHSETQAQSARPLSGTDGALHGRRPEISPSAHLESVRITTTD